MQLFQAVFCLLVKITIFLNIATAAEIGKPRDSILVVAYCGLINFPEILKETNSEIILICSDNPRFPDISTRSGYGQIIRTSSFYESGFVENTIYDLSKTKHISYIISINEWDVLRSAALRDALKIPGQNFECALAYRDKVFMKSVLKNTDIPVPTFRKIRGILDVLSFIDEYDYPVVVKPTRDAGANGVLVLKSKADLDILLETNHPTTSHLFETNYEVENFIEGQLFEVNGLIQDGKPIMLWPSGCLNTCCDILQGKFVASYILPADHYLKQRLCEQAEVIIKALPPLRGSAFHLEMIYSSIQDRLYFLEIASRVGGGGTRQIWNQSFQIDLLEEHVRLSAGLPLGVTAKLPLTHPDFTIGDVLIPPRVGVLLNIPESCNMTEVVGYYPQIKPGKRIDRIEKLSDNAVLAVVKAGSVDTFTQKVNELVEWFNASTEYKAIDS